MMAWSKALNGYQYVLLEDPSVTIETYGSGSSWGVATKKDGTIKATLSSGQATEAEALAEMERLMSQVGYIR